MYYIFGLVEGKTTQMGPFEEEKDANQKGLDKFGVNFEIKEYPTRNSSLATKIYKMELTNHCSVDEALKKISHKE